MAEPNIHDGCAVCSAPTGDDGHLCRTHTDQLATDLASVPELLAELEITRTRQDRIGAEETTGRSAERPLPYSERAADARTDLWATLNAWARDVSALGEDERDRLADIPHHDVNGVAAWLRRNLPTLRQHREAGIAFDEIIEAIRRARAAVDRPQDKIFAGQCGTTADNGHTCTEDIYGRRGATHAFCQACGTGHELTRRRDWMLSRIEDEVAWSGLLAGLVTGLGVPIGSSTIRRYAAEGRIKVIAVDRQRRKLYRVGDVLDVFLRRAAA